MKCPNGHETPEDSAFCENCGTPMAAVAAPPAPDPEPTPDPEPASMQPVTPAERSTESSSGGGNLKWVIAAVVVVVVAVGVILVAVSGGDDDSETTDTAAASETDPPADTAAPAEDEPAGPVVVAFDAAVGDCVNGNVVVACDEPHDAIVFHVEELPVEGPYPGNQEQDSFAYDWCAEVAEFEITPPIDIADMEYMSSNRTDWQNGLDRIVCFELL